ncbi:MAG TPA: hypothetical protein EYG27_12695 [Dehalococcoidia bacterium]|nr:hypothetical protein [Dehalococcoidia bacterium]
MSTKFSALLIAMMAGFLIAACGGDTVSSTAEPEEVAKTEVPSEAVQPPIWRYVNSGWVAPRDEQSAGAFSKELRVAVITSDLEMLLFNQEVVGKRTYGRGDTLGRPEFPGSVVLVAYLLWLPVQGDPLSVIEMEIEGNLVVVQLELEEDAQGRELPYLYAPMTMVTVDRSDLPINGPVDFQFRLDGETLATVTDTLR